MWWCGIGGPGPRLWYIVLILEERSGYGEDTNKAADRMRAKLTTS